MDMSKVNAESTTESVDTKFCENKKSEEVSFMDNAKVYMKSWVNASMDDHKACFKASWDRMVGRVQEARSQYGKVETLLGQRPLSQSQRTS